MISESDVYVWIWLPATTRPVVAGRLTRTPRGLQFTYGRSYLRRKDAIPLSPRELPLTEGMQTLLPGLIMPGCLRDASPDAWGRRVVLYRLLGSGGQDTDPGTVDERTFLIESGSNRIGALDFQKSATEYVARLGDTASLDELQAAADRLDRGLALSEALESALLHGSSIGGARPKALLHDAEVPYIAKFSSTTDLYPVVKAEYAAMRLARIVGIRAADVRMVRAAGRDVLLVKRFDREPGEDGFHRRHMLSALTLFELDEMMARYASYEQLTHIVRHTFADPQATLRELFARLVFNILCGNTDDHARNHAAFWDGKAYHLTPAFDICPQLRTGGEAVQAMFIHGDNRFSRLDVCMAAAPLFHMSPGDAKAVMDRQVETIRTAWPDIADEARLTSTERAQMWGRQFLNPYALTVS
ncbi:MAG: phosphatidylinositol kinase [Bacteroidetes bacterium CG12_big_fil_rev_8_21_14_0_65_60_17]|nr:MAG: phosphatidylinositol kinase [Bacteroidetes bacterium CG12_big_fil_rev_8_21_14_0_65_60_17]